MLPLLALQLGLKVEIASPSLIHDNASSEKLWRICPI